MQRFALIGAGFIGGVHAPTSPPTPTSTSLSSSTSTTRGRSRLAKQYTAAVRRPLDEVFDPAAIDAVFIASSTDTHAEHLRAPPTAGLPVLCEKPIDLDLARAVDIVQFANDQRIARDGRFQPPLRPRLRRTAAGGRVRRDRRGRADPDDQPRPGAAAARVHRRLRRPDARPDRPLLRPGPVDRRARTPKSVFATGSTLAEPRLAEYGDVDTVGGHPASSRAARWSRSTAPGGSATATTNASRCSVRPAWSKRAAIAPARFPATRRPQSSTTACTRAGSNASQAAIAPRSTTSSTRSKDAAAIGPDPREALKAQAIAEAATRSLTTGRMEPIDYAGTLMPRLSRRHGPVPVIRHRCGSLRRAPFR